ncbi:MAG: glycosyltransferase family 4 protein [Candidatus Acidiferrales bacterium]
MPRVLIIQAEMKYYRVPFFTGLHAALRQDGIDLVVAYSKQNSKQAIREDGAELPPEFGRKLRGRWFANRFLYQSVWKEVASADLVIVGNENKYLVNPFLLLLSALRLKTVAFWGLGPNRHPDRSPVSEWIKERIVTAPDWWFAYTQGIAEYLRRRGMSAQIITNVQNATDMRRHLKEIHDSDAVRAKQALTGSTDSRVGLYCGLLGPIKEIPLLLDAARLVRRRCPDFHLVIVGNGPERRWMEKSIAGDPWIHYVGAKFGPECALYYKIADLFMLAGTAGLAIVDSFAAGLPVIATNLTTHSPEIEYLVDGENGRITAHSATSMADAVVEALANPALMAALRRGAQAAGSQYTLEAMIENFRSGIRECLARYSSTSWSSLKTRHYRANNVDA